MDLCVRFVGTPPQDTITTLYRAKDAKDFSGELFSGWMRSGSMGRLLQWNIKISIILFFLSQTPHSLFNLSRASPSYTFENIEFQEANSDCCSTTSDIQKNSYVNRIFYQTSVENKFRSVFFLLLMRLTCFPPLFLFHCVKSSQKFLECKYAGNCDIDIFMRRKCPACRLKKCRTVAPGFEKMKIRIRYRENMIKMTRAGIPRDSRC